MANDSAITRLLYAILSQKCLKDVSAFFRSLIMIAIPDLVALHSRSMITITLNPHMSSGYE